MRIFANCMEAIKEIERDLFEMGIEVHPESMQDITTKDLDDFKTKELNAYAYAILAGYDKDKMLDYMGLPVAYAEQEILDRIAETDQFENPGRSYLIREDVWKNFLHDGKFAYTYHERLHAGDQLNSTIEELKRHPNTRQAIVQIYDYRIDEERRGGKQRVPCSLMYQFMLRNGNLDIHYFQRSGDFLTHLPYDIWLAIALRDYVADIINVQPGIMYHYVTSLHAYYKDLKERGIF